ncbi:hydrogenase nickel incorporation protein HypB [Helicobacter fennelliae]|uniref:[NiFe] hydrogenase nickel incorporation-associated protein HypB n=1 Tax=Helicobacter fennelliae MRY12-0050 TaxID=1325130 RepID=T1D3C7_9HELI|nr:hydrogenase nickel incorporation protein HypB [Helicobacter fennelliae]GAD19696.1 [NiFe] hydrogenase nickel incorporation-associated protein HypB [Helicobacter fennelliae MRY12-0050]STP07261.1 hydrogenase expression/formation protein HypB [Helicobacter fennelliae]STQ85155.1 hydrogenase expression/formation protein HypB [Helicobacter fennelliae]
MTREQTLKQNPNLNTKSVQIVQKILSKNDKKAMQLKEQYEKDNVYVVNFMSSPGSGKTTLLEGLAMCEDFRFAVIEGDLQTERDAKRLQEKGIKAYQIITGQACHLEAEMIEKAYLHLKQKGDLNGAEYVIIENVGNLVCPASYNLGADLNIVLLSTPEGDDKILKYPTMFLCADALIISKSDLIQHFEFDLKRIQEDLHKLKANVPIFLVSKTDKNSIEKVKTFIQDKRAKGYHSNHSF